MFPECPRKQHRWWQYQRWTNRAPSLAPSTYQHNFHSASLCNIYDKKASIYRSIIILLRIDFKWLVFNFNCRINHILPLKWLQYKILKINSGKVTKFVTFGIVFKRLQAKLCTYTSFEIFFRLANESLKGHITKSV